MKGLLCWLGTPQSPLPARGTSSGCLETGVGTKGQMGDGRLPCSWVQRVYDLLFPGLSQQGGSSSPSPASIRWLLQAAGAAISRVQSERVLSRLAWVLFCP